MQPTFERLKLWTRPNNYLGDTFEEYYCGPGRSRDSRIMEESNFAAFKAEFEGSEYLYVSSASHWAVGWVEQILIHKDAPIEMLNKADELLGWIDEFGIIDDSDYAERESEAEDQDFKDYINPELIKFWEADPANFLPSNFKVWKLPIMVGESSSNWTNSLGGQYPDENSATFWMVDDYNNTVHTNLEIDTEFPYGFDESFTAYRHAMDVTNNYWYEDGYTDPKEIYVEWAKDLRKPEEYQIPRTQYQFMTQEALL